MKPENSGESPELGARLAQAGEHAAELRDLLLEAARDAGMSGGDMWTKAESLLALARNADALRESINALAVAPTSSPKLVPLPTRTTTEELATPRARKDKSDYPKYMVRGDTLVKTGLGRDRRTEYEHVVSRANFERILQRIAGFAAVKRQFTSGHVQEGLECPGYQTYIALALLRDKGHIRSERRGQYSFKSARTFVSDTSTLWNELSVAKT